MSTYDPMKYFIWEVITQMFVAVFLTLVLMQMSSLSTSKQLRVVGFAGLLAFVRQNFLSFHIFLPTEIFFQ